jgi:hypothetical protein
MLRDDDIFELRRLLLTNTQHSKDIINNLLTPDNIRNWPREQVAEIKGDMDLNDYSIKKHTITKLDHIY